MLKDKHMENKSADVPVRQTAGQKYSSLDTRVFFIETGDEEHYFEMDPRAKSLLLYYTFQS